MTPPLQIIPRAPVGKRGTWAFVDRRDGSGSYGLRGSFEQITLNDYAPSPNGERLRTARAHADLSLGDTARALGLTSQQVSGLECGRYDLSDDDWQRVMDAIDWRAEP